MTDRRRVVVADTIFDDIDAQLPPERGPNGEPSAADFIGMDLVDIVAMVAAQWDDLPPRLPGIDNIRSLVSTGRTVAGYVVTGLQLADGTIELVELAVDPYPHQP